jgi:hypothetical protein
VPRHQLCYLGRFVGVGFGGKSERNISPTGSVFFLVSGRVRSFLRRCAVGVRLGVGAAVSCGVAVGGAAVNCGVAGGGAAVNSGVGVGDTTLGSCVGVGNSLALGVATIGASIVGGPVP